LFFFLPLSLLSFLLVSSLPPFPCPTLLSFFPSLSFFLSFWFFLSCLSFFSGLPRILLSVAISFRKNETLIVAQQVKKFS
jgi:hypothetical protein